MEVVRFLLHEGARIDPPIIRDNYGTPLYVAVTNGHVPVMMYLVEQGRNSPTYF
jgi:ankyrin repeat protein